MNIIGCTALITGANRGIGEQFARELLRRGALKVYAASRDVSALTIPGVEALEIDVTDPAQIDAAVRQAPDVDLLINNAGIASMQPVIEGDLALIRRDLEVNVFGTLLMTRAFASALGRNGGGALIDVLSAASWYAVPGNAAYSVSKAAAWNLTNAFRVELASQGTQVLGSHVGLVDTDMTAGWDFEKTSTEEFVARTLDALEAGEIEVVVDDLAREAKRNLSGSPRTLSL